MTAIDISNIGQADHAQERALSIVRLSGALIFGLYLLVLYAAGWRAEVLSTLPVFAACLLGCMLFGLAALIWPAGSHSRCMLSLIADQVIIALLIGASGSTGAPFLWAPVAAAIQGGLRLGVKFAYFSGALGAACMSAVMFFSPFWRQMPFVSIGVILGICVLPACAAALSARAGDGKRGMLARSAEMEEEQQNETRKKQRQHQAERAHVARLSTIGEMASGIAHEINQPLAAILSYNQACIRMLKNERPDTAEIVRAMTLSAEQAKRAGAIIKRLRSFVRKQAGRTMPVDLNEVIGNALVLIEHGLRDHQIVIDTEFQQPLPAVIADSIQLEQVVLNLIRNAMDAMSDLPVAERRIALTTRAGADAVNVDIMDHGPGVPSELLLQLFDPFFTTKTDGMGLGLTISRSIIEAFGGTISARNAPQRGAIFSFALPVHAAPDDDPDSKEEKNARTSRVPG